MGMRVGVGGCVCVCRDASLSLICIRVCQCPALQLWCIPFAIHDGR